MLYMYNYYMCHHVSHDVCTGRDEGSIEMIESYLKAVGMFRDYSNSEQDPSFSQVRGHACHELFIRWGCRWNQCRLLLERSRLLLEEMFSVT